MTCTYFSVTAAVGYADGQIDSRIEGVFPYQVLHTICSSEEPSAARIAELKHFVKEHGINYIYFEENGR